MTYSNFLKKGEYILIRNKRWFVNSVDRTSADNLKSNNGWYPAILLTELINDGGEYKIYFMYTNGLYTLSYNNLNNFKNDDHYVLYFSNNYDINSILYNFKIVRHQTINNYLVSIQNKQQLINNQFKTHMKINTNTLISEKREEEEAKFLLSLSDKRAILTKSKLEVNGNILNCFCYSGMKLCDNSSSSSDSSDGCKTDTTENRMTKLYKLADMIETIDCSNLEVSGTTTLTNLNVKSNLSVGGSTVHHGDIIFNSQIIFNNSVTFKSSINIEGDIEFGSGYGCNQVGPYRLTETDKKSRIKKLVKFADMISEIQCYDTELAISDYTHGSETFSHVSGVAFVKLFGYGYNSGNGDERDTGIEFIQMNKRNGLTFNIHPSNPNTLTSSVHITAGPKIMSEQIRGTETIEGQIVDVDEYQLHGVGGVITKGSKRGFFDQINNKTTVYE